jgi:hypothetical protein
MPIRVPKSLSRRAHGFSPPTLDEPQRLSADVEDFTRETESRLDDLRASTAEKT